MGAIGDRIERERDYWDHVIPTVEEILADFEKGPAPNVALMLDVAQPAPGRRIIDFACGGGVTSLWLAQRGADVTGIDLSPVSIDTAREAAERAGLDVTFEVADLEQYDYGDGYDAMVGKYALHHLDVGAIAPAMARCLKVGGTASFVETMATNPLLRIARGRLTGKYGIPRYGTVDEHPLVLADVEALAAAFGECRLETRAYEFLRIFDRQILRYKRPGVSRVIGGLDDRLARVPALKNWSYHQVLIATRALASVS